jgi:hypothetical protein
VGVQNAVRENVVSPTVSLDILVPRVEQYYERLVGKHLEGQTFKEFVNQAAKPHIGQLVRWRFFKGSQLALLLVSHSSLSVPLSFGSPKNSSLVRLYDWLTMSGDALSRVGAVEAGLSTSERTSERNEALSRLLEALSRSEVQAGVDPYQLLSATIMAVYGEIAYSRALSSKPPYWRRLAAIAQAALVARAIIARGGDAVRLVDWLRSVRARIFVLQCYVDLRIEPRWIPDFMPPDQLKNELLGRAYAAGKTNADAVAEGGWEAVFSDNAEGSLKNQFTLQLAALAGPLEGGSIPVLDVPHEQTAKLKAELAQPLISASSLIPLVNAALLVRVPVEMADMAADAIARADYRLNGLGDDIAVLPYLHGLASLASTSRSQKLADAVFTLISRFRQFYPETLSVAEAFRIAMVAAASRAELSDWSKCVGGFTTYLAFQSLTSEEAFELHANLVHLCHLVPELWATCGQAEAALQSLLTA